MAVWEVLAPRRRLEQRHGLRVTVNLGFGLVNALLVRIVVPLTLVGVAALAAAHDIGLLAWLEGPAWLEIVCAVLLLDLAMYWQHRAFHVFPLLWRVHRMHHADPAFDVTTGVRFHPLEIVASTLFKLMVILLLGPAAIAVAIFEMLLSTASLFNHGNVRVHPALEGPLRVLLITPDLHRIHHTVPRQQSDRNFGNSLSFWDRIFGTWLPAVAEPQETMPLGVASVAAGEARSPIAMLRLPFARDR